MLAVGGGGQAVAARAAVAGERARRGEEALGVAVTLASPHPPFPLPGRLVRMLRPVVAPLMLPMLDAGQDRALGRPVTGALVGDDHAGHVRAILEQATEELLGGNPIPTALHQDSEDVAVLSHGAPPGVLHAVAADEDRVEMPRIARAWALATQRVGVGLAALARPPPHRLVGHLHAALSQQFLHVALAQGEAEGAPDRVRDDLRREPMPFVVGSGSLFFHAPSIAHQANHEADQLS